MISTKTEVSKFGFVCISIKDGRKKFNALAEYKTALGTAWSSPKPTCLGFDTSRYNKFV